MEYNLGNIRDLIKKALTNDELNDLVFYNFRSVYDQFTDGQSEDARIRILLEYVEKHQDLSYLLVLIKNNNNRVYQEFSNNLIKRETLPLQDKRLENFHMIDTQQPSGDLSSDARERSVQDNRNVNHIDDVEKELNRFALDDIIVLANLLTRSGRAALDRREALCIEIGVDYNDIGFLSRPASKDFALELIQYLHETDNTSALDEICLVLEHIFKNQAQLKEIKTKLKCQNITKSLTHDEVVIETQSFRSIQQDRLEPLQTDDDLSSAYNGGYAELYDLPVSKNWRLSGRQSEKLHIENSINTSSVEQVNYTQLGDFLAEAKWKEADYETYRIMLQAAGSKTDHWLRDIEIENFPCSVLQKIDQLWASFSNNRFGFKIQQRIWLHVGGKPGVFDSSIFHRFGDCIGWRANNEWLEYDNFFFTSDAPPGHLPSLGYGSLKNQGNRWWGLWSSGFRCFCIRMPNCFTTFNN